MTPEIERLAGEAWIKVLAQESSTLSPYSRLARFYAIAAEDCVKVCEALANEPLADIEEPTALDAADAIRAKFAMSDLKDAAK